MAYYDHRYQQPQRHDNYYPSARETNGYSRHANYPNASHNNELTAMSGSSSTSGYPSYHTYDSRYAAPSQHKRSSAHPSTRHEPRHRPRWPPLPSVEDEKASLAKEVRSSPASDGEDESAKTRGSVDQNPIIEELEQPTSHDRRFVLLSDPQEDEHEGLFDATRERRRKSFAERGHMPHLKTDVEDEPQLFAKRTPTPYAYTKPQKESIAPDGVQSPEAITPSSPNVPRSGSKRDVRDAHRDQNAKPPRSTPTFSRHDSSSSTSRGHAAKNNTVEDSDSTDDATHLRTERKPARYSFVKNDLQKEDLRTSLRDSQAKSDKRRTEQPPSPPSSRGGYEKSSGSSSNTPNPRSQSPRAAAASSSKNASSALPKHRPAPVDTSYDRNPRPYPEAYPSRPASPLRPSPPLHQERPPSSPKPAPTSRPSSRSGPSRPPSPLSSTFSVPPNIAVTGSDWHATYPPTTANDWSHPPSRYTRYDSMPVPAPRIDVQSPSPSRPPKENPLPYPVDDKLADVFMPPEQAYQFDHAYGPSASNFTPTYRQPYPDSPNRTQSPLPASPRERPTSTFHHPPVPPRHMTNSGELPRSPRVRSDSFGSQSSADGRRGHRRTPSLDRPMPSCPRSEPSSKHDDWYTLENCPNFDICPTCYKGVFADTQFADYFRPVRRYDERFCDFSSAWMRLAWLLTIKQQRKSPDLIYSLATIADVHPPCPRDLELPGGVWYGLPDQRDGVHVANFAVCACDLKRIEALFPSIRGYLTRLEYPAQIGRSRPTYTCALRTSSKRFEKYLDLLVEIDDQAAKTKRPPDIERFIKLVREHAFKAECARDEPFVRRPWHFISDLPELTVCEECYDDLIWPAMRNKNAVALMFNRTTQLVPGEDAEGASCCLYSPRMRRIWNRALEDEDFAYLRRKAVERKKAESRLNRERRDLRKWIEGMESGGVYRDVEIERLRKLLRGADEEWRGWE